jgi:predicted N-acetyltransferase YhbS
MLRKLKLPKHELPVALIARLAVPNDFHKQGIGSLLLMDALARCARAANEIGGVAIVVDTLDRSIVAWYERLGFVLFEPESLRMFMPVATIRDMLRVSEEACEAG